MKIKKEELFYIPNLLTYLRFGLIPFFAFFYLKGLHTAAILCLAVSVLSDFLDGKAARRLDQISEIGILLDPVADKLTQATIVICLGIRYPILWGLFAVQVLKELFMLFAGYITVRKQHVKLSKAEWYGKVSTGVTDGVLFLLLLFDAMPEELRLGLVILSAACMAAALVLYLFKYIQIWHGQTEGLLPVEEDQII